MQIINTILNPEAKGWKNHPIVIMWTPLMKKSENNEKKAWILNKLVVYLGIRNG